MNGHKGTKIGVLVDLRKIIFGDLTSSIGTGGNRISQFDCGKRGEGIIISHSFTVYAIGGKIVCFAGRGEFWSSTMDPCATLKLYAINNYLTMTQFNMSSIPTITIHTISQGALIVD